MRRGSGFLCLPKAQHSARARWAPNTCFQNKRLHGKEDKAAGQRPGEASPQACVSHPGPSPWTRPSWWWWWLRGLGQLLGGSKRGSCCPLPFPDLGHNRFISIKEQETYANHCPAPQAALMLNADAAFAWKHKEATCLQERTTSGCPLVQGSEAQTCFLR